MHFTVKVQKNFQKKIITKRNVDAYSQFAIIDNLPVPSNPFSITNYILPANSEYSIHQFFNKK